jgi:hypothetical protein
MVSGEVAWCDGCYREVARRSNAAEQKTAREQSWGFQVKQLEKEAVEVGGGLPGTGVVNRRRLG